MEIGILYDSVTGNTKQLAEVIGQAVTKERNQKVWMIEAGAMNERQKEISRCDLIFVGFWADKGNCSDKMKDCLGYLDGKMTALFGTAGFGGGNEYFERILKGVSSLLPGDSLLLGTYMCQGRMPLSVRKRYEQMDKKGVPEAKNMIENFDRALVHPDETDLTGAEGFAMEVLRAAQERPSC